MDTQQILILCMIVLFVTGLGCGHAIGYSRRRDQVRYLKTQVRILQAVMRENDRDTADRGAR